MITDKGYIDNMNILFLTTIIPRKERMGSEVASQCFIDALNQNNYAVSVLGYMRKDDVFETNKHEIVIEKRYIETKRAKLYPAIWLLSSLLKNLPYSAAKYYSRTYIKTVKALLLSNDYDVVIIDHPQLGWLKDFIKNTDKLITLAHNVEQDIYQDSSKNAQSFIARLIYRREADLIKKMEDTLAKTSREVWTLTQHDAKYFSRIEGAGRVRVFALPPGLAKLQVKPLSKKFDIGIIGSWAWKANIEGLQWFLKEIYPQLPASVSIHIAGRGAEWLAGKYPNVHYRGFVPDVQEFMAQARVIAIPILSGGGIPIKTLDAIASGSAIVATPVAMRGIDNPPQTVQVAYEAETFAELIVSAIAAPYSQQAFDEALNWYCTRRDKFITDIACAFNEL